METKQKPFGEVIEELEREIRSWQITVENIDREIARLKATPAAPAAVGDDAPLAVRTAPKKIWLNLGDDEAGDCDFSDLEEVTWSSNNASGCGIEYVRAAIAATPAPPATEDSSAGDLAEADAHAKVTLALGLGAGPKKFAWSYLLGQISELVKCEQELILLKVGIERSKAQAEVQAEPVALAYPHEQMDALAISRYKIVPSDQSMYWRHAVVAGDGQQHLYNGSEVDCKNLARKFAGAFLDGAFAFHSLYTSPQATQQDALLAALQRAHDWMDSHADSQSKGNHATFDILMLREERDAALAAIQAAQQGGSDA